MTFFNLEELSLSFQYLSCLWPKMSIYHGFNWVNYLLKWMYCPYFPIHFCGTSLDKLFWKKKKYILDISHLEFQIISSWFINASQLPNQKYTLETYTKGKECISWHLPIKLHKPVHPKNTLGYSLSMCAVWGKEMWSCTNKITSAHINFRNRHLPMLPDSLVPTQEACLAPASLVLDYIFPSQPPTQQENIRKVNNMKKDRILIVSVLDLPMQLSYSSQAELP